MQHNNINCTHYFATLQTVFTFLIWKKFPHGNLACGEFLPMTICHVEISPHDRFSLHGHRDKYQVYWNLFWKSKLQYHSFPSLQRLLWWVVSCRRSAEEQSESSQSTCIVISCHWGIGHWGLRHWDIGPLCHWGIGALGIGPLGHWRFGKSGSGRQGEKKVWWSSSGPSDILGNASGQQRTRCFRFRKVGQHFLAGYLNNFRSQRHGYLNFLIIMITQR